MLEGEGGLEGEVLKWRGGRSAGKGHGGGEEGDLACDGDLRCAGREGGGGCLGIGPDVGGGPVGAGLDVESAAGWGWG